MANRRRESVQEEASTYENLIDVIDTNERIIDKDQEDLRQEIIKRVQQTKEVGTKKKPANSGAAAGDDDICIIDDDSDEVKESKPAGKISIKSVESLKQVSTESAKEKKTKPGPASVKAYPSAKKKTGAPPPTKGGSDVQPCAQCKKRQHCKFKLVDTSGSKTKTNMSFLHFCTEACVFKYQGIGVKKPVPAGVKVPPAASSSDSSSSLCMVAAQWSQSTGGNGSTLSRSCTWCSAPLSDDVNAEILSWETFEFCKVNCLQLFQRKIGALCSQCTQPVPVESLGKYCVRFGCNVNQFCVKTCLDGFKQNHRPCFYCQTNMSANRTLYRVEKKVLNSMSSGNKMSGSTMITVNTERSDNYFDFCDSACVRHYQEKFKVKYRVRDRCAVCRTLRPVQYQVDNSKVTASPTVLPPAEPLCSERCLKAFTFVNKINPVGCESCQTYFNDLVATNGQRQFYKIYFQGKFKLFCDKICHNYFVQSQRIIVECAWCKVKKYNFDMIVKNVNAHLAGQSYLCSMNCLTYMNVVSTNNASTTASSTSQKKLACDFCGEFKPPRFHLSQADNILKNFCSYGCTLNYQKKALGGAGGTVAAGLNVPGAKIVTSRDALKMNTKIAPAGRHAIPRTGQPASSGNNEIGGLIISDVRSLAASKQDNQSILAKKLLSGGSAAQKVGAPGGTTTVQFSAYKKTPPPGISGNGEAEIQLALKLNKPARMNNKVTQCRPMMITKGVYCKPMTNSKPVQTGEDIGRPIIIPIPVPIFIPNPMAMYSVPYPVPVPIPFPVPVPVFIPTTRNSARGIMQEIQNIREKIPSDPFEAELLLMAEMAENSSQPQGGKQVNTSDSEQEDENSDPLGRGASKENNVLPYANDLITSSGTVTIASTPYPTSTGGGGAVDYSLSHFLPAVDPLQSQEPEVESSIDAESSLQSSKIVKTAGPVAPRGVVVEDVVIPGPKKDSPGGRGTRGGRGGARRGRGGGRGRGRGGRGRGGRGRAQRYADSESEEEEEQEESEESEEEELEEDEYQPPVTTFVHSSSELASAVASIVAGDTNIPGNAIEEEQVVTPTRTVQTRRSLAASGASTGTYVESTNLTPQDFIPSEYLGHVIDDEGNLVYDATSGLRSPPGMYQSDEDFCPDYTEDVDDPDFEEELHPRKRKRSAAPQRRRSARSRLSGGSTSASSTAQIASVATPNRPSSSRSRGGSKRKLEPPAVAYTPNTNVVTTIVPAITETPKCSDEVSLKYMLGVDAINKFIVQKNVEIEKAFNEATGGAGTRAGRMGPKLFKTDLLSMTPDELNRILCYFIKEVRRPNGSEYAPDTMYYLCLCIQYYLIKHDRIDNIFCDPFYTSFILTLDGIAQNFIKAYNDTDVIVTRVEEEYLWESKQLGAYSPHTLINSLMYFNSKFFLRFSLMEHEKLSFQRLTINFKFGLNKKGPKILRMLIMDDSLKLTKIEIEEDLDQPLRCPVKLYEFYLSKW
uniref:Zinc finger MYM-type protein 4 n=1 Tax=Cacopsylla melanoneura TaxID=428564 RepID=A0A8D9BEM5_9HEMI